ncbi:MAG TPA: MarR family transcriptional regulator, partial [Roseiflexaceae bacterium]
LRGAMHQNRGSDEERLRGAMHQNRGSDEERHNMGQFRMLEILRRGSCSLSGLAAMHHVTPSTMSRSIDVLVRKGWVTRENDPHDRRQVILSLTEEGRAAHAAVNQHTQEMLAQLLEQLDEQERARLYDGLSVLQKLLGRSVDDAGHTACPRPSEGTNSPDSNR